MSWFEIFCCCGVVIYTVFVLGNLFTLYPRKAHPEASKEQVVSGRASIIIAARNEAQNILGCLQSLSLQQFPREQFEVIVVNDHSEDETAEIALAFLQQSGLRYSVLELAETEAGKKAAILKGVAASKEAFIITRDADTTTDSRFWLHDLIYAAETQACDLLIAPVLLDGPDSFPVAFQKYENLALNLLSTAMASNHLPILCSGANLLYKKETFAALDPYSDNLRVASGDDMFLLNKAVAKKKSIRTLASAGVAVFTPALTNVKQAIFQRLRWSAKTARILNLPIFFSGLILLMGNIGGLVALICLFIDRSYLAFGLFTLTIKFIIDFLLLFLSARMFKVTFNPTWYLPAFLVNLFYTPALALVSVFVKPGWKGRKG